MRRRGARGWIATLNPLYIKPFSPRCRRCGLSSTLAVHVLSRRAEIPPEPPSFTVSPGQSISPCLSNEWGALHSTLGGEFQTIDDTSPS